MRTGQSHTLRVNRKAQSRTMLHHHAAKDQVLVGTTREIDELARRSKANMIELSDLGRRN